jgi:hypothetical protein
MTRIDDLEVQMLGEFAANQQAIISEMRSEFTDMRALLQREFTNAYHRDQAMLDTACPNAFALEPQDRSRWRERLQGERITLHLWCQEPGDWHPTENGGRYQIDQPARWLGTVAPIVQHMVTVMKYTAPVIGPWLGVATPDFQKMFKNQIGLMKELVNILPEIEDPSKPEFRRDSDKPHDLHDEISGSALRAVRKLLDDKDPEHAWGGLNREITPEGHILWLCNYHRQQYRN